MVNSSLKGDFTVDQKYVFEVGGAQKGFSQIADIKNSYLAIDDIQIGRGHKIPLWLFGFLYWFEHSEAELLQARDSWVVGGY